MAKSPKSVSTSTSFVPWTAPDFTLPCSDGTMVHLADLRGHWIVLFFYPTDNTPTCTKEACAFSEAGAAFAKVDARLFGLSKDSLKDHDKFIRKYSLSMPLLSDESTQTINAYGAWGEKSLYGRLYMGTDRSTYLIDPQGLVRQEWRKVKVNGHVEEVLSALESFIK